MAYRFLRYVLRTPDVAGAHAFYTPVFGSEFIRGDLSIAALSEQALARGGRAHWLGHIGVNDVETTAQRILSEGGQQLGPTMRGASGQPIVVLRDPFGAMLALDGSLDQVDGRQVALHVMHSSDERKAFGLYASLFHWEAREVVGTTTTRLQSFTWNGAADNAGSFSNMAGQQGTHPQWLYFFPVEDIESASMRVRANGGLALDIVRTEKSLLTFCDDAHGAAFGLCQPL